MAKQQVFPSTGSQTSMVEPNMEAAGIEPANEPFPNVEVSSRFARTLPLSPAERSLDPGTGPVPGSTVSGVPLSPKDWARLNSHIKAKRDLEYAGKLLAWSRSLSAPTGRKWARSL